MPVDKSSINNGGSNPSNDMRRSDGSANDPHGGHENIGTEREGPDPDPIDELVPGGQGAEPPRVKRDNSKLAEKSTPDHHLQAPLSRMAFIQT